MIFIKKKNILIGLTLISALSFAKENNLTNNEKLTSNVKTELNSKMVHKKIMQETKLPKNLKLELDQKRIAAQELELSVKKTLLGENVEWDKVLETNKKISLIQAEVKTSLQKFRYDKKI